MNIVYPSISANTYVPEDVARRFIGLHYSLCCSLQHSENGNLIYNRAIPKEELKVLYNQQINAIKNLLTDDLLKDFWDLSDKEKGLNFFNLWQATFNNLATKPRINETEKKKKLEQAKGSIDRFLEIMLEDPSLQREIGMAIIDAVNLKWPQTKNVGLESWEAIETQDAEIFIRFLSKELGDIPLDQWKSTHKLYPGKVTGETAIVQIIISGLAPAVYNVLGVGKHKKVSHFLKKLFPDLNISEQTVRDASRD